MLPYLSLVLAVRNERKMLPGLIDQLLEQNYPPEFFEILVVDGGFHRRNRGPDPASLQRSPGARPGSR